MLYENVSASLRLTWPADSPPALHSGTVSIVMQRPLPSMIVVGVYLPLWSAAVAVITLNVDPGAYKPWVARLTSGEPPPARLRLANLCATELGS